jgi:hypothetical protein
VINKYELYERAVQSPDVHIEMFNSIYQEIQNQEARSLREDFCGTFQLSCAWIQHHENNSAICIDLDPEPLNYGKKHHYRKLKKDQQKRLKPIQGNVLTPTRPGCDLIIGCNFSFFIFKKRNELLSYFKTCLKSLNKKGVLILEMAGGPGMITPTRERKTLTLSNQKKFTYVWDQKSFDPISRNAHYAIHFKFPNGSLLKDSFTYDWRLWTIPEVRDALHEAGFKKIHVYWETEHQGKGTGEYAQSERGDNAYAWIAYIAAAR